MPAISQRRRVLGWPHHEPAPGELAATFRRSMPVTVRGLDAGGWIAWCLAGVFLFAERVPTMAEVRSESRRIASTLAMLRARGNVTRAAAELWISRRTLRDHLRAACLYPWHTDRADEHDGHCDAE